MKGTFPYGPRHPYVPAQSHLAATCASYPPSHGTRNLEQGTPIVLSPAHLSSTQPPRCPAIANQMELLNHVEGLLT
jgi:hypothetical protein